MPIPVKIPKLGMSMTAATLVRWLIVDGEPVEPKQSLAEIETDKIVSELESPAGGTLSNRSVAEGDIVPVAQTIAWILADGESAGDIPLTTQQAVQTNSESIELASNSPASVSPAQESLSASGSKRASSSPAVRRLAREQGVELSTVIGSGPDGRITKQDVLQAAQQGAVTSGDDSVVEPLTATRRAITGTVTKSATIPTILLNASADASALIALRQQDKTIAYDDILIRAVAKTLQDHKYLNASYEDAGIRLYSQAHIGLAVAVSAGLLIPVIRGAEKLSLIQIGVERNRLVELVRSRKITAQHMAGGTCTITNLGMYPVDSFTALINPPQAAILSVGRIVQTAVPANDGGVLFQPRMMLGLTLDHRVADGAAGAAFLKDLITRIECPDTEVS